MSYAQKLNIGINVDVGSAISELSKAATRFKENRTYNKTAYDEILGKYAESLELIEVLRARLGAAEESKLPTTEEIENMGKIFDMLGMMNEKMPELAKLQKSIKTLEDS